MSLLQVNKVPNTEIGYGRMGVMLEAALNALGVTTVDGDSAQAAQTVLHCSIPTHLLRWREGQRLVLLSMFESNTLPEAFRESMHHFDLVIVPSEQNRDLFSRYHPNVAVINLGVDPSDWHYTPRATPTSTFTFLHGGSGLRKGGDVAALAFRLAFPDGSWGDGPEPRLILKSPKPADLYGQRISQINGRLSAEDEIRLYETAHCYVQPSRGEGFGLQPLQALAQGLPTILTDAHGHAAFAHLGYGIEATFTPTPRGSFMLGDAGDWWEPDVQACADRMRWVYENYPQACAKAAASAREVAEHWTWTDSARQLLTLLGPLRAYEGSGVECLPTVKRYRTVLNRPHAADIAGHSFRWEAFTPTWEIADVKRILFEGGYLDPSCVDGDSGLTEEQVERAGLLSGKDSVCGTCHQRLNTQPTRADLLDA